jgi:uncharacterized protein (TIGR02271 family)
MARGTTMHEDRQVVVPLFREEASLARQRVITRRVQVSTVSRQHEEIVEALLTRESVEIERTPLDQPVDCVPPVRHEGDTIIIPVVEEVLIVERRLVLKEEVRVRRVRTTEKHQERVQLRRQEVMVTRDADAREEAARNLATETKQQNS